MQPTGERWRLGHRPALDGLRGIAVLMVLTTHLRIPGFALAPAVGVVVFFTLSGFLITTLQLEQRRSLPQFWLRRAARLAPAMLLCLALYVTLQFLLAGTIRDGRMVLGALTYTGNWVQATGVYDHNSGIGHLWSLGIEEQFYLLWPILLLGVAAIPRRWALLLLGSAVTFSLLWRADVWLTDGYARAYYGLDTRADELLIGCALALLMHGLRERRAPGWVAVVALGGVFALSWSSDWFGTVWMPTLAALLAAVVLYVAVNGGGAWLSPAWLVWVGQRSYGIYLYHLPLRWAVERFSAHWWVTAPVVLVLAFVLAELSWRHVERPILSRSRRSAACPLEASPIPA